MDRETVYVALLRGINVGGNNMVAMKALKESFERLGFHNVRTYINSGNVVFTTADGDPIGLEERIDRMLKEEYGLKGGTVVRSRRDIARVVKALDKEDTSNPDWRCSVVFLRNTVDPKRTLKTIPLQPDSERVVCCPGTWLWTVREGDFNRSAMLKLGAPSLSVCRRSSTYRIDTSCP